MATSAIGGYYGFGNAGDELILQALVNQLRAANETEEIIVLSHSPDNTARTFGVRAVQRWSIWDILSTFRASDRFILGGGGLLQESTGSWNHLYYLSLLFLAKAFGCGTEVRAIGVDPVSRRLNRFLIKHLLNRYADWITVRDEESAQVLREAGVTKPISVVSDPVCSLPVLTSSPERKGLALALKGNSENIEKLIPLLEQLSHEFPGQIDLLVLFPKQDSLLAEALQATTQHVNRVRVARVPQDLLKWIPEYELVIASRFHALVLAASSGIPFIGCGNQKKVESFCKSHVMPYVGTSLPGITHELLQVMLHQKEHVVS